VSKNIAFPKTHCFPKKHIVFQHVHFLSHCFETKNYHWGINLFNKILAKDALRRKLELPTRHGSTYIYFLTRFSTKILVTRLVNGGRAVGRAGGRILNGVKLRFPLNNFSLLWPIDTKLSVWVA